MAKVLVVDDSSFQRKWIIRALKELGLEAIEAENGKEGLNKLKSEKPACITVDLNMPEMNGIEFLKNMKDQNKSIPVIVITADIQSDTKKECQDLGASAFLNKPFKNHQLHKLVNQCLGNKGGE